jgi:hypothetical protein
MTPEGYRTHLTTKTLFGMPQAILSECWEPCQGITERKRAEEALRNAHDRLETRIQERTCQLGEAHESLQAEMDEWTRVEEQLRHAHKIGASALSPAFKWKLMEQVGSEGKRSNSADTNVEPSLTRMRGSVKLANTTGD